MKKYIHVNQHVIRSNKKNNENEPVITVKEGRKILTVMKSLSTDHLEYVMVAMTKQYSHAVLVLSLKQRQI